MANNACSIAFTCVMSNQHRYSAVAVTLRFHSPDYWTSSHSLVTSSNSLILTSYFLSCYFFSFTLNSLCTGLKYGKYHTQKFFRTKFLQIGGIEILYLWFDIWKAMPASCHSEPIVSEFGSRFTKAYRMLLLVRNILVTDGSRTL